ncbi:MAG: ABC transporter ATP-binding protein [Candidatus Caldarchaeum sp.]|nr:ABC transporter ATP-binding protein [Candidatus Caldarchaeum sp.]MDW8359028.1 ABC transporter ATP-binding protein [Candidatus Caldarchaeum sp.]
MDRAELTHQTQSKYSIELLDIVKEFSTADGRGRLRVIDGLTIRVKSGSFSVIIGPSGCGKSTLLNIVSGISTVEKGRIVVDGYDIVNNPSFKRKIGYVFQSPRLLEWRTLKENVIFALNAVGNTPKEQWDEIAERYLKLVGLDGFINYYPLQVSGGMQQRAAIARAFAIKPEILLMDEPFSHLDEITAETMRNELIRIWSTEGERKTVVFVTHDLREAVYMADEIFMLTPRPARLYKHYKVDVPRKLRTPESEELFEVFKEISKDFHEMIKAESVSMK